VDLVGERNLRDLLEERAALYGDRDYLIAEDKAGAIERFSYRAFDERVNQVANGLLADGIRAGDKVVIHLPNIPPFLLTLFALAKIGVVAVPTNIACTADELVYLFDFSEAVALVSEPAFRGAYMPALAKCPRIERIYEARTDAPEAGFRRWDALWQGQATALPASLPRVPSGALAQILFTSGTTARPKGVMHTHAHMVWSGEQTAMIARYVPGERALTPLPCFHVNAQSLSVLGPMTAGCTLVLLEGFSASRFWQQVRRHKANVIPMLPALMRPLLLRPPSAGDRDHEIRIAIYGINCAEREKAEFEQRFDVEILNGYGLTEALTVVTSAPIHGRRQWPSVGPAAIGREVKIVDPDGQEVAPREIGELLVKGVPGRTIMLGYYKNPTATQETLSDGWLRTGDNFWADESGYLYFVDRKKDIIKRGGENISASEVELALMEHPSIKECAVIAVPDPIKDEAVKAFVVLRPGAALREDDIIAHCQRLLARFKGPQFVEIRDELPKTPVGKVEKKLLRQEEADKAARATS
jgi:crotonobetaine/carnitine-CoA ligase